MSKIYKLREWLTVPEAAKQLSISFGEEVTEADVLRLSLDGRLPLSVYFVNHAQARGGKVIPWEETDWWLFPDMDIFLGKSAEEQEANRKKKITSTDHNFHAPKLTALFEELPADERRKYTGLMRSVNIDNERFVTLADEVVTLYGVLDLPMIGAETLDVERRFQQLTGGPGVELTNLDGAFVEGQDGTIWQLQEDYDDNEYTDGSNASKQVLERYIAINKIKPERAKLLHRRHAERRKKFLEERKAQPEHEHFYPAGGLPNDSTLVVRTKSILAFEQAVSDTPKPSERPISRQTENKLHEAVALLAAVNQGNVEEAWKNPHKTAQSLLDDAQRLGLGEAITRETLGNYIKAGAERLKP
ncbi:hypothetical protein [Silvimonas sp.]|uniref:hypothetical protein n=1 Tax=Silvimonas sp. TaxID=2650811 RepID=UPI00283DA9BD|nr:hypothetical protein [Silvimonas sp.]MDR3429996.1 hypothetical protein [Silvimonas sp.]